VEAGALHPGGSPFRQTVPSGDLNILDTEVHPVHVRGVFETWKPGSAGLS